MGRWVGGLIIQGGMDADSQNEGRVEDPLAHSMLSVVLTLSPSPSLSLSVSLTLAFSSSLCFPP